MLGLQWVQWGFVQELVFLQGRHFSLITSSSLQFSCTEFYWDLCFWAFGFLVEVVVAVGSGEQGSPILNIASPSSSNKLAVSISQAGYLLEGFTFAEKFDLWEGAPYLVCLECAENGCRVLAWSWMTSRNLFQECVERISQHLIWLGFPCVKSWCCVFSYLQHTTDSTNHTVHSQSQLA